MKVTKKMTLKDYDQYCKENYPNKIPDWFSKDYRIRLGDCIYDYLRENLRQRKRVHKKENEKERSQRKFMP